MTKTDLVSSSEQFAERVVHETCQLLGRLYGCSSVGCECVDADDRLRRGTTMTGFVSYSGSHGGAVLLRCSTALVKWMDQRASQLIGSGEGSPQSALGQLLSIVVSRSLTAIRDDSLLLVSMPAVVTGTDHVVAIEPFGSTKEIGIEVRTENRTEYICVKVVTG